MHLTIIILFLCASNCFGQSQFEKGYLVDTLGQKVECFIKNENWLTVPKKVTYIIPETSTYLTVEFDQISTLQIDDGPKYVRAEVDVDQSSTVSRHSSVSTQRTPEYKRMAVVLKVITEGEATLYLYQDRGFRRFFLRMGQDGEIIPLVQKIYRVSDEKTSRIRSNNRFRQQLKNHFKCVTARFDNLRYLEKDLRKIFIKYNTCANDGSTKM